MASFAVFCFLAVSIPLSIRWWIINATDPHDVALEVLSGTALVRMKGLPPDVGVTEEKEIPEGSVIRADANCRALLTFFDGSMVNIFPNAEVRLTRMRSPSFGLSPHPNAILLELKAGRIRISPTASLSRPTDWKVRTSLALVSLGEGSYAVEVNGEGSEVAVRKGEAKVDIQGTITALTPGKRMVIPSGSKPPQLLPARRNLILNGDFSGGLNGWRTYSDSGKEEVEGGKFELVDSDGGRAVRLYRQGEDGVHTEVGLVQEINADLSDYISLQLRLDLRIDSHSLGGGGYLSSEYPIIVRLDYLDAYGSATHWYHGFYYHNIHNNPTLNGEAIRRGLWYPYETTNLLEILDPPPLIIKSIKVYASGWNYDGLVTDIGLFVE